MREGVKARNMANERTNPRHYVCLSKRGERERERERERENKKRRDRVTAPPLSLSLSIFLLLSLSLSVCLSASVCLSLPPEVLPSRKYNGHSFVRVERHSKGHACNVLPPRRSMPTADSSRVESAKCPHQPTCTHDRLCRARGQACDNSVASSDCHASDVSRDEASTDRRFY